MTLMPRKLLVQQGTTTNPVKTPAEDWRLATGGLITPSINSTLGVHFGVVPGVAPPGVTRPLEVTVSGLTAFTINPGHFTVGSSVALAGPFFGVVDSAVVRRIASVDLPGSGQYKFGYLFIHVYDQTYGDAQDGFDIEYLLGAAAASAAAAAAPSIPASYSFLQLAAFTVDSTGAITLNPFVPRAVVARGGILPVQATDTDAGAYVGAYRDHPTAGLQRWSGTAWQTIGRDTGWVSTPGVGGSFTVGPGGSVYRVKNGWVALRSQIAFTATITVADNTGIYILPAEAWPSWAVDGPLTFAYGGTAAGMALETVVGTNGLVSVNGRGLTAAGLQIYATWPAA